VHEAAAVAAAWPAVERRGKPLLLRRLHEDGKVQWKHIAVYVPVLLLVIIIGAFAIWSFLEKQSVSSSEPTPLPKVTLITADPRSPFTAAWVRLLTDAEMQPTLVPLDKVEVLQGVIVLCDVPALPPSLLQDLDGFVRPGGAGAVIGQPPSCTICSVAMFAAHRVSDGAVGPPQLAKAFTPEARTMARSGFMYSVDPLRNPRQFSVRMTNRGEKTLQNPTVKVWLPPGVTHVALGGDLLMKRNVTLTGVPEEGACLIGRPRL